MKQDICLGELTGAGVSDRICRREEEATNGCYDGIHGHCAAGFAEAAVCGGAEKGGGVPGDLVLLRYFSTDAADVAGLRAAGRVWVCGCGAGDLPAD